MYFKLDGGKIERVNPNTKTKELHIALLTFWWFVSFFYSHPDNITPDTEDPEPKPMIIGTNNVFEVGCCILYSN